MVVERASAAAERPRQMPLGRFMKAVRVVASAALILSAISLLIAVALNFANIIGRYVFFSPIASAEEVMLFLFVGTVFLGNSVVGWEGKQIRMDIFLHAMPAPWRRRFDLFADIVVIAVSVILIVVAWPVIEMLAEFDERSQAADIPLVIPQALLPIGLGLNAILVGARMCAGTRASPHGAPKAL
jgi:TRAP-type C4-dicarboxylate transport system permease small subunit